MHVFSPYLHNFYVYSCSGPCSCWHSCCCYCYHCCCCYCYYYCYCCWQLILGWWWYWEEPWQKKGKPAEHWHLFSTKICYILKEIKDQFIDLIYHFKCCSQKLKSKEDFVPFLKKRFILSNLRECLLPYIKYSHFSCLFEFKIYLILEFQWHHRCHFILVILKKMCHCKDFPLKNGQTNKQCIYIY